MLPLLILLAQSPSFEAVWAECEMQAPAYLSDAAYEVWMDSCLDYHLPEASRDGEPYVSSLRKVTSKIRFGLRTVGSLTEADRTTPQT